MVPAADPDDVELQTNRFLREDGVWTNPPDTTYSAATQSKQGLMSTTDKIKLDGIESGANNYVLPTANSSALGGVKIGSNISISSGVISVANAARNVRGVISLPSGSTTTRYLREDGTWVAPPDTNTTYSVMVGATSSANGASGLVPAPTKENRTAYLRADGTWNTPTNTTYSAATQSAAGLMSATDKVKLDGIATGANNYTLPQATSSVLGGVKIGSNITVSSGVISLTKANVTSALGYTPPTTNTTYSNATTSAAGLMSAADKTKLNNVIKEVLSPATTYSTNTDLNSSTFRNPGVYVIWPDSGYSITHSPASSSGRHVLLTFKSQDETGGVHLLFVSGANNSTTRSYVRSFWSTTYQSWNELT